MCLNPLTIRNPRRDFNKYVDPFYLTVPCGKCAQCQKFKLIDLETRAVTEYEYYKYIKGRVYNYTLTYDESHVPWYCGIRVLCRRDFQLFKKRLKKFLGAVGDSLRIAYFGEIGKRNTKRSHFHILIFSDIQFDSDIMAAMVHFCWKQGFIGYPKKIVNGQKVVPIPSHAVVDGVNALRYCIKYCSKSYDLKTYLYQSFLNFMRSNGIYDVDSFVFPEDDRFKFPEKATMDLDYIVNYFSSCYRLPNDFGIHQLDKLDTDYNYTSSILYKGNFRVYHISNYCKSRIFNISCVYENNVKITHKTKRWIDYIKKTIYTFAYRYQNNFLANKSLKLTHTNIPYDCVQSALESLVSDCDCSLFDYYIFRTIYVTYPLSLFNLERVLELRQSRDFTYTDLYHADYLLSFLPNWLKNYDSVLNAINQEIYYQKYLKQYKADCDYQDIKSAIYGTVPNYPILQTFQQLVNPMIRHKPQPIESEEAPKNYGILPSADGTTFERVEVPLPLYPTVNSFDIDTLSSVGLNPQTAPNIITPTLEEFQSSLDNIDYNSKP